MCDINRGCLKVLADQIRDDPETCIVTDVQDFFNKPKNVYSKKMVPATIFAQVMRAKIKSKVKCARHGGRCLVRPDRLKAAGTPCQDWARCGSKLGWSGPRAHCTYQWLRLSLASQEAVHENVWGFPRVLEEALISIVDRCFNQFRNCVTDQSYIFNPVPWSRWPSSGHVGDRLQ